MSQGSSGPSSQVWIVWLSVYKIRPLAAAKTTNVINPTTVCSTLGVRVSWRFMVQISAGANCFSTPKAHASQSNVRNWLSYIYEQFMWAIINIYCSNKFRISNTGIWILILAYAIDQIFSQITTGCDITNSMEQSYSLDVISSSASQEFPNIFKTRMFIIVFTTACHLSWSEAKSASHPIS